jgi:hypothetical protein
MSKYFFHIFSNFVNLFAPYVHKKVMYIAYELHRPGCLLPDANSTHRHVTFDCVALYLGHQLIYRRNKRHSSDNPIVVQISIQGLATQCTSTEMHHLKAKYLIHIIKISLLQVSKADTR